MSKNFELLQRVAKDVYFSVPDDVLEPPRKPSIAGPRPSKREPPEPGIVKLVQQVFAPVDKGSSLKVVCFMGIARDDRSSWICARAGEALAEQSEASVCVVEANFWSPRLHVHLGAENQAGLAEALTTKDPIQEFAVPIAGRNLSLVPAGVVKPGFYPSIQRYRERFHELREVFDYILISAPPLQGETDTTRIAQLTDGAVLVVEANQSRRETVRRAKEQLESAKIRLIGAVLDQRTFPIPEKLYRRL
jgi:Mrp family chromosome partitioning ATPase